MRPSIEYDKRGFLTAGRRRMRPGRRAFLAAGGALIVMPAAAQPRADKVHRIGFVSPTSRGPRNDAFAEALKALGYVDGRNVIVEMRFAAGHPERLAGLMTEMIAMKVDVLVVGATIGALAARSATTSIPIVFAGSSDPVAGGIVTNLARPEGNITGVSLAVGEGFAGKWLDLLKEAVPDLSRCAALWSSSNAAASTFVKELEVAASKLKVRLDVHHAAEAAQLDQALGAIGASRVQGLVVTPSPFAATHRDKLVRFTHGKRLPAMFFDEDFADAGGLMSYGPSIVETYRQAALYVDRILRGAKPADLPVEQPTRFVLVVNLTTARLLDVRMPQSLLVRADRTIG